MDLDYSASARAAIFAGASTPRISRPRRTVFCTLAIKSRRARLNSASSEITRVIVVAVKLAGQVQKIEDQPVRLELAHALLEHVVELNHGADELQLLGELETLDRNALKVFQRDAAPGRLLENTRHARVGVLHVEHRVVARLALGQLQVE